jgi:two-component system NtrC family sensor kinase
MRLANRIFLSFFGLILLATLASTLTGALLLSQALRTEALTRVQLNLREARSRLAGELEQLAVGAEVQAQGLTSRLSVPHRADITLLFPSGLPAVLQSYGLHEAGLQKGFLALSLKDLAALGVDVEPYLDLPLGGQGDLLCLFAAHRGADGLALALSVLNGNEQLVRQLQENLFSTALYGDKPFGTVTVFSRDTRVATTVLGPGGRVALGTRVSAEVRRQVLERGETWLGRAFVVDEWYLSAYEPIQDPRGERVGILYVGVLEQKYRDIRTRSVLALSALIIPILGVALVTVFFIARGISRPLARLAEASGHIGSGNLEKALGPVRAAREIRLLAEEFTAMQEAISDRESRLRQQNQELEQANRDYQELLSFVTHELNNSVGSLLLNVSLLAEEDEQGLSPDQREVVEQLLRDVERFRDMVRNYLNVSRLEKGTLRYSPQRLDLRTRVLEPVLARLGRWIEHRRFEIRWQWPGTVEVFADADLLDICYGNFLVNALKYGRDWICFSAEPREGSWLLGVANGGNPLPADKIPLLFRKFSRLVHSSDGAGLGLYLVRRIVERHGGQVWCESTAEEGTRFLMLLPRAPFSAQGAAET